MKLSQLVEKIQILSDYEDIEITALTDDSRKITSGCVFFCISGAGFDGHSAALAAVEAGAAAVVCQRDTGAPNQLLVNNSREAYALACAAYFGNPAEKLKMIGITGTNGKTTTTFILKNILESTGKKTGLIGTVKNMVGAKEYPATLTTPDPYELHGLLHKMADEGCEYCVMEVSSQALDQNRTAGILFNAAMFTNLSVDHLDYHKDFEHYAQAKRMLFDNAAMAIVNLDDEAAALMTDGVKCPVFSYSVNTDSSDYTAKNIRLKAGGAEYELVGEGVISRVYFGVPGTFSVYNSMGAAVCALKLGIPMAQIVNALKVFPGVPGRLEVVPTATDYTVIIDYADTPAGPENILGALREVTEGRIITVFGCGGDRDKTKRPKMGEIAGKMSDVVVVTSDNPRTEEPSAIIEDILAGMKNIKTPMIVNENRTEAIAEALKTARKDDVVVLAGKGHETYQILKTGKIHYDEREVVANILEGK